MNQGLYGLGSSGAGSGVRKLAGQIGRNTTPVNNQAVFSALGVATNVSTAAIGVRTRILSVSGRGAARLLNIFNASGTSSNLTIEVFFDGVRVVNDVVASISNNSVITFGFSGVPGGVQSVTLDWIPFDSSYEVFVTSSAVINPSFQHITDVHQ